MDGEKRPVPEWIARSVDRWKKRLGIVDDIEIEIVRVSHNDEDVLATTYTFPMINMCRLAFCVDVQPGREGEITVIHEMLHVKEMRINNFLEFTAFPESSCFNVLNKTYRGLMESYTHSLATALYEAFEAIERPAVAPATRARIACSRPESFDYLDRLVGEILAMARSRRFPEETCTPEAARFEVIRNMAAKVVEIEAASPDGEKPVAPTRTARSNKPIP